jgi:4-amino-4-deoxy-L-arabinose transferase-like glycosyltransferase
MTAPGRTWIGWVLVAGLALRLVLLVAVRDVGVHIDDERDYVQLATSIDAGRGFAYIEGRPTSARPPLYPALIAGLWRVTGSTSLNVVRTAQIAFSLGSVIVLFALARYLFNPRVALWAAAAWCFYPSFLYAGVVILTEVLFTFLVLIACLCAVLSFVRPEHATRWALATGLAVGLAALTRSVLWPLPIVLIPVMVSIAEIPWKRRVGLGAAVLAGYAITVGPWAVRNTRLQKTLVFIDTIGGLNLRMGNYEYTPEDRMWAAVGVSGTRAWSYEMIREHPDASGWTDGQRERWARDRAIDYMRSHPATTIRRAALKFADFWGLEREYVGALRERKYTPPLWFAGASTAAMLLTYVLAMGLASIGLFARWSANWRLHVVPLLMLAAICGIHTIVFGHSRYHLPVMPILLIYAAAAAAGRPWREWRHAWWRAAPSLAAITLLLAIWSREVFVRDPGRIRQLLALGGL